MGELADAIGIALVMMSVFGTIGSCVAVMFWVHSRQREREALYRSEAIKKLAEMQGNVSEPVLALLREALNPQPSFPSYPAAAKEYRREREAFHRAEMFKRLGELHGADAVLDYLREEDELALRRRHQGTSLAGALIFAIGLGMMIALPGAVDMVGAIPVLIGIVLIAFGRFRR